MYGAGVASIGADFCLTPSENAMRSPSKVGVGSRFGMGRMSGVFARVTLACVKGAALMSAVDVGLVELWCALGSYVGVFVVACWKILANCCSAASWRLGNCVFFWRRGRMA